jgi:hypothetical protein
MSPSLSDEDKLTKEHIYKLLHNKPIVPNKTYPLNKEKVNKFLSKLNIHKKEFAKIIFKHTKHISYKDFKFILNDNFKEFIDYCYINNIKSIALFLGQKKINKKSIYKSNFWIAQHFYQYIKNIKIDFNIIYDKNDVMNLTENHTVVVFDDCAYTGFQLSNEINASFNSSRFKNFNIYVIIPFISEIAINRIKQSSGTKKIIFSKKNIIIKPLSNYLNQTQIDKFDIMAGTTITKNYPIYFDHKLADIVSTFTDIYSGYIDDNTIIPVITNCEHANNPSDYDALHPKCPLPSYKFNSYDNINLKKYSSSSNNSQINKSKSPNKLTDFIKELNKPPFIPIYTYKIDSTFINKIINDYNINKINQKNIFEKIINNIIHVSYPVFKDNLEKCFDKFIEFIKSNNITKITIVINTSTIYSSTFWTTQHFFYYLNKKSIKLNIDFINNLSDIKKKTRGYYLILEDCIYNEDDFKLKKLLSKNHFFIISPYIIKKIYEKIEEQQKINNNIYLYYSMIILSIYANLTSKENEIIKKSYKLQKYLQKTLYKYVIYFDHNIYYKYTDFIFPLINNTIPSVYYKDDIKKFKDKFKLLSEKTEKKEKECPEGKILNPKTNRCISIQKKVKNTCPKSRQPINNKCTGDYKVIKLNKQNFECCYKK